MNQVKRDAKMRYLITGAGGQLGKEWARFLKNQCLDVHALKSNELDITDEELISQKLGDLRPSCVINCAAFTNVDLAEDHPDKADRVNHLGIKYLSQWCSKRGVPIVHYSTDYIFPGLKNDRDKFPAGYPEDAPKDPMNRYGKSKLAGEKALEASGARFLLVRVSWLCGQFGKNFVSTMLRLAGERKEIKVVNDQWGSPSFADRVVDRTFQLIDRSESGVYHISSAGLISWYDFACEVFRQSGLNPRVSPVSSSDYPMKAQRPMYSKLNCSKISRTLDAEMEHWETGLSRLLKKLT